MIKSDFIACGILLGAISAIVGIISTTLPMTVTAQNTTDILTSTRGIHNSTSHGDTIVLRGIGSSEEPAHLVLPPGEENQGVNILHHRPDGATYSGILTFTATKPVEVGIGHRLHIDNSTLSQFETELLGDFHIRQYGNKSEHITPGLISFPSRIIPDYGISPPYFSASIPFVGGSLFLKTEGEPFVAVYEVVADVLQPQIVVDIESANVTNSETTENGE
jgi:hypothetical protein